MDLTLRDQDNQILLQEAFTKSSVFNFTENDGYLVILRNDTALRVLVSLENLHTHTHTHHRSFVTQVWGSKTCRNLISAGVLFFQTGLHLSSHTEPDNTNRPTVLLLPVSCRAGRQDTLTSGARLRRQRSLQRCPLRVRYFRKYPLHGDHPALLLQPTSTGDCSRGREQCYTAHQYSLSHWDLYYQHQGCGATHACGDCAPQLLYGCCSKFYLMYSRFITYDMHSDSCALFY